MSAITVQLTADAVPLQCRHIRPDGRRCGSPALRAGHFCYHHDLTRRTGPRQPQVNSARAAKSNTFSLPTPADLSERSGLQLAVGQILHKIAHNEIDPRRAGLLLYGLQIASSLLPKTAAPGTAPLPEQVVEEIVEDPELGTVAPPMEWAEAEEPVSRDYKILQRWADELAEEAATSKASNSASQTGGHTWTGPSAPASSKDLEACAPSERTPLRSQHRKQDQVREHTENRAQHRAQLRACAQFSACARSSASSSARHRVNAVQPSRPLHVRSCRSPLPPPCPASAKRHTTPTAANSATLIKQTD